MAITIAIDFDGTCVTHEFPNVGQEIGATEVLQALTRLGHKLILYTMRSNINNPKSDDYNIHGVGGNYLDEAVQWFKNRNIPLYGIQKNPKQSGWTHSPKCYAELYIDDAALGCPLKFDEMSNRPYVDWAKVKFLLIEKGIL